MQNYVIFTFALRMGLKRISSVGKLLLIIIGLTWAQEDSLRSALNAIDRRQRDLSEFSRYDDDSLGEYGYSLDGPDDLAFLSPSEYNTGEKFFKEISKTKTNLN